ncbi:hypothetical protein GGTG_05579 [Gaeumannomyces tritici R3-111a-1]|uniref:DUF7770 domain-containing protein n=1 Tax=Gaeumannomyces tritici (strain R3-111a-1) TaxID=644352 RepID=J3NWB5_GAET3|nr:hypothetical protein GGTG_05579 [Gaeumannomyces tritici R3-111a-1]EJT75647.1 hypothetical protein GGTG_05579 [Gaeumannomyces tritici R3-111a-1]
MGACFSKKDEEEDLAPMVSRTSITHDHIYYTAPAFERVSYISHVERDMIRNVGNSVLQAYFVAEDVLEIGGNHWSIYLETTGTGGPADDEHLDQDGKEDHHRRSVRLSLSPSAYPGRNGPLARLQVQACPGSQRRLQGQHEVALPPLPGHVPAARFIDALADAERPNFEFTRAGRGGRGWVLDAAALFLRSGLLVDPDGHRQAELARAIVGATWGGDEGAPTPAPPLRRGTYYRVTSVGVGSRERPWDERGPDEVVYWKGGELIREARYHQSGP